MKLQNLRKITSKVKITVNLKKKLKEPLKHFFKIILNLFAPSGCFACNEASDLFLCNTCDIRISFLSDLKTCNYCGYLLNEDNICKMCIDDGVSIKLRSVCEYEDLAREFVLRLKSHKHIHLAKYMSSCMLDLMNEFPKIDIIAPVPIHWLKLFINGFNHSAILAKELALQHNIQFIPDLLHKKKYSKKQASLSRQARLHNKLGIILNDKYKDTDFTDKNILIVDDVITTGATMNFCAKALNCTNANIYGASFGRTILSDI